MKEAKIITDRSEVHRTYLIIYGTLGICLLGYAAMTVRYIWNMHQIPWMDVLTEIIFLLSSEARRSPAPPTSCTRKSSWSSAPAFSARESSPSRTAPLTGLSISK